MVEAKPSAKPDLGQHVARRLGIQLRPAGAAAAVRDRAGQEVAGDLGPRREAGAHDGRTVDADRDRPPDDLVVERGEPIVEADVGDVQALPGRERQLGVGVDGLDVARRDDVDGVHRSLAQLGQPLARVGLRRRR